jgi:hypothetical protein
MMFLKNGNVPVAAAKLIEQTNSLVDRANSLHLNLQSNSVAIRWAQQEYRADMDQQRLLGPDCQNVLAHNFEFDSQGRAQIGSLNNRSAHPDFAAG